MPSEDSKAVKVKAGEEAEERKSLSSIIQARKNNRTNAGTLITRSRPKDVKVKKEKRQVVDDDDDDKPIKVKHTSVRSKPAKLEKEDDEDKPVSKKNSASKADKELTKKKKKNEEDKKKGSVVTQRNGKKREKRVYDLPGQKRDPPEERDALRIFYETLHKQIPNSEMAQIWMMESGLLSKEKAMKVYEQKQKRNQNKLSSPIKTVTTTKKTQSATVKKKTLPSPLSSTKKKTTSSKLETKQTKKRKVEDESSEDNSDDDDFVISRSMKKQRAC